VFASFAPASALLRFCFASASAPSPLPETSWDILFQFDVLSVSLLDQVYRLRLCRRPLSDFFDFLADFNILLSRFIGLN